MPPCSPHELARPQPPRAPDDLDCCGSGCGDTCVWSLYRLAQQEYLLQLQAWELAHQGDEPGPQD